MPCSEAKRLRELTSCFHSRTSQTLWNKFDLQVHSLGRSLIAILLHNTQYCATKLLIQVVGSHRVVAVNFDQDVALERVLLHYHQEYVLIQSAIGGAEDGKGDGLNSLFLVGGEELCQPGLQVLDFGWVLPMAFGGKVQHPSLFPGISRRFVEPQVADVNESRPTMVDVFG